MSRTMRIALYLLLMCSVVLTACGGGADDSSGDDADTPVVQDTNDAPSAEETDTVEEVTDSGDPPVERTPPATADFVAPPIGVLGEAATEDPEPGAPEPLGSGFSYIFFEQTGGVNDVSVQIEVYSDGRLTYNGAQMPNASQVSLQQIARIIDEVDFFGMQATFLGPPRDEEDYRYRIAIIQDGGRERLVQARDGYIPREVINLLGSVRGLVNSPPESGMTPVLLPTAGTTPTANP